jgi:hypothetical protein
MSRDMSAPNWARTLARLRRNIQELRAHDVQVIEPPDFELPPNRRGLKASGGANGPAVILGEHGPELLLDRPGAPVSPQL